MRALLRDNLTTGREFWGVSNEIDIAVFMLQAELEQIGINLGAQKMDKTKWNARGAHS